jgi:hypothetical protein
LASLAVLVLTTSRAHADGGEVGPGRAAAPAPAPPAPVAPLAPVVPPPTPAAPAPENRLRIEWREVVWGNRHGHMLHAQVPFQNGRLLEGEELYLAVDRPDLAASYRSRVQAKKGVAVAGYVLLLGSGVVASLGAGAQSGDRSAIVVAACLSLVTGFGLLVSSGGSADVVAPAELRRLIDAHNQSL